MKSNLLSFAYLVVIVVSGTAFVLGGVAYMLTHHAHDLTPVGAAMMVITFAALLLSSLSAGRELLLPLT